MCPAVKGRRGDWDAAWGTLSGPTAQPRAAHRREHRLQGKTLSVSQEEGRKVVCRSHTSARQLCRALFSPDKGWGPWTATAPKPPALALPQAAGVKVQTLEKNSPARRGGKGRKGCFLCHWPEVSLFSYLLHPNASGLAHFCTIRMWFCCSQRKILSS